MMDHLPRPARAEDWPALVPLLRAMGSQEDEEARRRFLRLAHSDDHYLPVASAGTRLVGYGWVQDYGPHLRSGARTVRLHDLFVLPDHRRAGLGTLLFGAMRGWAEQRGARYLEWQASQSALPFYERLGYQGDPCPQPEYPFFEVVFPAHREHTP